MSAALNALAPANVVEAESRTSLGYRWAIPADFGEPATYRSDSNQSYEAEHETIFQPMERLLTLIRRASSGINHIVGAIG